MGRSGLPRQHLLDSIPDGLVVCDAAGSIRYVNTRLAEMSGYGPADLIGEKVEMLVPGWARGDHERHREGYAEGGYPARPMGASIDTELRRADGTTLPVDIALSSHSSPDGPLIMAAVRDPTLRSLTRDAIEATNAGFRDLIQRGTLLVVGLDNNGVVTYVNPRLCELSGVDAEEALGAHWFNEFIVDDELEETRGVFGAVLSGRDEHAYHENRLRIRGRRPRTIGWFNIGVPDSDGNPQGTLSAGEDVTARRRLEQGSEAIANVTRAILEDRGYQDVLALIAQGARTLAEAGLALVATEGPPGHVSIRGADGPGSAELIGKEIPGDLWLRQLDLRGRPIPEGSSEAVPLPVARSGPQMAIALEGRRRHGVLVVHDYSGAGPFEQEHLEALHRYARQAALALEHGEAHQRLSRLAVIEDRERIARDLHDMVIQDLFAAGLNIEFGSQLLEEHQEEVRERLDQAVETLNQAIDELRHSIFTLRHDTDEDLRSRVMRLISESTAALGLTPVVRIENTTKPLPEVVATNLLATLREAISNVARHSEAAEVEIQVRSNPGITLVVEDNGQGLSGETPTGQGLANMAERARRLGGNMTITESEQGGVHLEWHVPLEG